MTIKRLAIMGVLMIASVVFTLTQVKVLQDPPGVTTRWFDGTKEQVETYFNNGKLESRTTYGDDGQTIITYHEWDVYGKLSNSKIRRQDGKVEEKAFERGVLVIYFLWSGDMTYTLIERNFAWNGRLVAEIIKTEDGKVVKENRRFYSNGKLEFEHLILGNADQTINYYHDDGTPYLKQLLRGNGSRRMERLYANGNLSLEVEIYDTFGNGSLEAKSYTEQGVITKHLLRPGDGSETLAVYNGGKMQFKQHFTVDSSERVSIEAVELFEFGTDTPSRKVEADTSGIKVYIFGSGGELKSVKHIANGKVVKQFDYAPGESAQPIEVAPAELKPVPKGSLSDQGQALREMAGGLR